MRLMSRSSKILFLLATATASGSLYAQDAQTAPAQPRDITITDTIPVPADLAGMPAGPVIEGFISARKGNKLQVTTAGGKTIVFVSDATSIKSSGGFLGASTKKLGQDQLLNGLPVTVKTVQWDSNLVASQVTLKTKDLKTASMIRNGTDQRFDEQTAATEALRGRVADIDNYIVKATTNVNFDTGKADLSPQARADLCAAAASAQATNNSLLLVLGYTDSTGSEDTNQALSEKRAAKVVNYLQQKCGWKPYRMLTPTGMATADPAADNSTPEGKAQNRRVAVNVMVSKAVDGM
ncbi:OmpA family protein [Sphingomonas panacisoli]|uniref:OmpA family protein n=1 Tax=Sphingomonas panacisoli TaxID=1813879 RepID=A0A5B8LJR2_9SPHN|nr:OmpA family protein [Sphingomonas panacisoli]QDZ08527.1 OmpA family protein [Sphingomonas panacisoli]